jgi:3',5'-cyclic AMP phosphodiesterase CpdA
MSKIHNGELAFVQISDSHMGFDKPANTDVIGTFKAAIDKINALPIAPEFILHTGDISHLAKPGEFDNVEQILKSAKTSEVLYVPGEHDFVGDEGKQYLERFGKGSKGSGWYSFDKKGVHFIGLVNVANLKSGGLGSLGSEQLEWIEDDVKHLKSSTPVVVFAHIPLWTIYPTGAGAPRTRRLSASEALRLSHGIGATYQTMQKVEGNVTFTHAPQPFATKARCCAISRPNEVPADQLRSVLG